MNQIHKKFEGVDEPEHGAGLLAPELYGGLGHHGGLGGLGNGNLG